MTPLPPSAQSGAVPPVGIILRHGTEKIIQRTWSGTFIDGNGPGM